jgi:hypothetical protein
MQEQLSAHLLRTWQAASRSFLFGYRRTRCDGNDQSDHGKESRRTLIDGSAS